MVGKGALAAITHPQGMAEFTASQLGMQAPGLVGAFAGFLSPVPGGAWVGMGAGELLVETGAAVTEALHKRGIDTSNEEDVRNALYNSDVLDELYKEGAIKASTVALFGIGGVGVGMRVLSGPARTLGKDLIKAGVTKKPLNKGGMAEGVLAEANKNPAAIEPINIPPKASLPKINPTSSGAMIANTPGKIISLKLL